jgi:hypothetical protein
MSATLTTHRLRAHTTTDYGEEQRFSRRTVPLFLNVDEAAGLLRTTRHLRDGRATPTAWGRAASSPRRVPLRPFARLAGPEVRAIAEGVRR